MTIEDAKREVAEELERAYTSYNSMTTPHDGYAVILEELEELWDEVKRKPDARSQVEMRKEAKQVAAMAIRFMVDLT